MLRVTVMTLIIRPYKFTRDPAQCCGFLLQCQLYFEVQEGLFDQSKIVLMLSLLIEKVLIWAAVVWEKGGEYVSTYECFVTLFCWVFDHAPEGKGNVL